MNIVWDLWQNRWFRRIIWSVVAVIIAWLIYAVVTRIFSRYMKHFGSRKSQKAQTYLRLVKSIMRYILLILVVFVILQINGIDITKENKYEGWFALIFIAFILLMFILSIYKLVGALDKNDIIVIGLKEMTFISALTDVVIIQAFISRIILSYYDLEIVNLIDAYLPLAIGVIMTVVSIKMMARFAKYEP